MLITVKELIENLQTLKPEEKIFAEFFTKEDCELTHNEDKENPPLTDSQWEWLVNMISVDERICADSFDAECDIYEKAIKRKGKQ
jgi:hypothetical protein